MSSTSYGGKKYGRGSYVSDDWPYYPPPPPAKDLPSDITPTAPVPAPSPAQDVGCLIPPVGTNNETLTNANLPDCVDAGYFTGRWYWLQLPNEDQRLFQINEGVPGLVNEGTYVLNDVVFNTAGEVSYRVEEASAMADQIFQVIMFTNMPNVGFRNFTNSPKREKSSPFDQFGSKPDDAECCSIPTRETYYSRAIVNTRNANGLVEAVCEHAICYTLE